MNGRLFCPENATRATCLILVLAFRSSSTLWFLSLLPPPALFRHHLLPPLPVKSLSYFSIFKSHARMDSSHDINNIKPSSASCLLCFFKLDLKIRFSLAVGFSITILHSWNILGVMLVHIRGLPRIWTVCRNEAYQNHVLRRFIY